MTLWIDVVLWALAVPWLVASGYLFFLAAASRRRPPPEPSSGTVSFDVLVPAHNEEAGIGRTVKNLLELDYPAELRRVVVVADNCSDRTAECAQAAGATVWVRNDAKRRGKGYALSFAFERSLAEGKAQALVVVDADTLVSKNLLGAFATRLDKGAQAIQAEYTVQNRDASWRTRLMTLALALFHLLRSLGRERLSLSAGLRGNGMCFAAELLRKVPHEAFSVVEDLEYGIRLGEAGHRVVFAEEAKVYGDMVATEKASRSQRQRWEGGRWHLFREKGLGLFRLAVSRRDPVLFDLAMDLAIPPLTFIALAAFAGLVASAGLSWALAPLSARFAWGLCLAFLLVYVLRGWRLSGVGARGLLDLAWAPFYMGWRLTLLLRGGARHPGEWVRTTREGEKPR